jgi:hypothetical protein
MTALFLLTFLLFLLLAGGFAFAATNGELSGRLLREGPGPIRRSIRRRNQIALVGVVILLVVVAALESLIPDLHLAVLDVVYTVAAGDPVGVTTFASGAGLSWGIYLGVLFGALVGLVLGSLLACRRHEHARSLGAAKLI